MDDLVPATLPVVTTLGRIAAARPWLAALPTLIAEVREQFGVRLGAPWHAGSCSWVAPAVLPDGTAAVVKIGWPHREMYGEPVALRRWAGRGAVRLLAHDPARHALLLERCEPGTPLSAVDGPATARLRAGAAVLRRLWSVSPPDGPAATGAPVVERLGDVTAEWAELTQARMDRLRPGYDPGLVAEGVALLRALPGSAGRTVLLHGDANPGNILAHTAVPDSGSAVRRGPDGGQPRLADVAQWRAIDPKPMVGDPAYDPWPLLEQIDDPFGRDDAVAVLRERVALLADELELSAERIAQWAVARRVEAALWTAAHGDVPDGATDMARARILAAW
ncbi:aminoglycoside phosphotransferase family protein [Krasilnikovia sp. MM14-A1259]|uniref:aminoglycoside phosphotransferase family protein n=1 Tax=Krasilnikovia sp. MM14-A1259 TaxID=3373539 RepID=UPI00380A7BAD